MFNGKETTVTPMTLGRQFQEDRGAATSPSSFTLEFFINVEVADERFPSVENSAQTSASVLPSRSYRCGCDKLRPVSWHGEADVIEVIEVTEVSQ